jgi:tetratricopeptide (TPR) repeat protein
MQLGITAWVLVSVAVLFTTPTWADDRSLCFSQQSLATDAIPACARLAKSAKQKLQVATALNWRGSHLVNAGKYSEAISDLDNSIKLNPKDPLSYFWRARAKLLSKNASEAIEDASTAIQLNSKDANSFQLRAEAMQSKGDIDGAQANFAQAIKLNPNYSHFYFQRGALLAEKNDYDGAIADFGQAIKLDAKNQPAIDYRAFLFEKTGDADRAIQEFTKSIDVAPNSQSSANAYHNRGTIFSNRLEYDRAIDDFRNSLRIDPKNVKAMHGLAIALAMTERYDDLISICNQWLSTDPSDWQPLSYLATAWQGKKDFARALEFLDKAVAQKSDEPSLLNNRGNIHRDRGDLERAFDDYDKSLSIKAITSAYSNRGLTWRVKGNLDSAVEDFNRALSLDPANVDAFTNRGLTYEARGELDNAKSDYQSAIAGKPKFLFSRRYQATAKARLEVLLSTSAGAKPKPVVTELSEQKRVALVVGNGRYASAGALANPPNDARLLSAALKGMGYEVVEGFDLGKAEMTRAVDTFLFSATTARIAIVFYAGHGMQVDGKNYLVPVDFEPDGTKDDLASRMIDVDFLLSGLDDQVRTNVVILDACRNNPTVEQKLTTGGRAFGRVSGLAAPSGLGAGAALGAGTLLAFATAPGQVALDGDGSNSPFSAALSRHISTPGLEVQQMLTRVRSEVVFATKSKQVPWSNSSLLGEVFLVR